MSKIKFFFIIICLGLFLILPTTVMAFVVKTGDAIYVAADETVDGNFYAAGNSITIEGHIVGDVIGIAARTINISGRVEGDIICAARYVNITGEVLGSVRVVGNSINITGPVARNAQMFGMSINLSETAAVGWDILMFGQKGEIKGKVGRDIYGTLTHATIDGEVGKNIRLKLNKKIYPERGNVGYQEFQRPLTITANAKIGGDIHYTAGNKAFIAEKAAVAGQITHDLPEPRPTKEILLKGWAWGRLFSIFSALVVGLVLVNLWRKQIIVMTDRMLNKIGASIGRGAIIMFVTPLLVITLTVTIIGIPLGLMITASWLAGLYLGKIIVGILIGRHIMERVWHKPDLGAETDKKNAASRNLLWAMIVGILISWIIFTIPVIGWILSLIAIWWGLGGIWLYFRRT